jgi:hypothetical protein
VLQKKFFHLKMYFIWTIKCFEFEFAFEFIHILMLWFLFGFIYFLTAFVFLRLVQLFFIDGVDDDSVTILDFTAECIRNSSFFAGRCVPNGAITVWRDQWNTKKN